MFRRLYLINLLFSANNEEYYSVWNLFVSLWSHERLYHVVYRVTELGKPKAWTEACEFLSKLSLTIARTAFARVDLHASFLNISSGAHG